nr:transposase [Tautonia rosea]
MRKPYPSDLTDDQWATIEPLIPVYEVGRPREVDMREVLNAILYLNRSGCQWDMLRKCPAELSITHKSPVSRPGCGDYSQGSAEIVKALSLCSGPSR